MIFEVELKNIENKKNLTGEYLLKEICYLFELMKDKYLLGKYSSNRKTIYEFSMLRI